MRIALPASLLLVAVGLLPLILSSYQLGLVTKMLIFAIFATSLNLKLGYTGLPSFGHAAYFGVSAYTVGLLALGGFSSVLLQLGAGLLAAVATAALFGLVALRAQRAYFFLITLAFSQVLWGLAFGWRSLTGGDDGLPGVPRPRLGGWSLGDHIPLYYFVVVVYLITTAFAALIVRSHFGRSLLGIRENELRMQVLGYNVWLHKYIVFIIAGALAGISGVLYVYYNGYVGPAYLSVVMSAMCLIMVVLGGAGTFFGPTVGSVIIVLLENVVSAYTQRWLFVLGAVYVAVTLFAPNGVLGARAGGARRSGKT
ncbi:MAG: branched-chain amino acid ABC transporter permease [Gammaproteobacteria bacterium]